MPKNSEILNVKNVTTSFSMNGKFYDAINNINLTVNQNDILALVGESGCGKSTLATTIMGLHNLDYTKMSGEIIFEVNTDLLKISENEYNKIRGAKIGMIFQDPLSALNPLKKIKNQIAESLLYHTNMSKLERYDEVLNLLEKVGINKPELVANQFPYQLSGGMRQRVVIAIACKHDLLISDEPTTALDVTIQAQILDLLKDIQAEYKMGIILITHDLGVVAETADKVAVMYAGQIVEKGSAETIFNNPKHPYTRSLLKSIPQLDSEDDDLYVIQGKVPILTKMPDKGDLFAPRIPWVKSENHEEYPQMHNLGDGHYVRCICYKVFDFPKEKLEGELK